MLAIIVLRAFVGPILGVAPAFGIGLRVIVVIYLLHLAAKLWQYGAIETKEASPVTFSRVLVTTLFNPKAIIFAFTLLPTNASLLALTPWLSGLAILIFTVGSAWIAIGASMTRGLRGCLPSGLGYRISAVILAVLAGVVSAHAFVLT